MSLRGVLAACVFCGCAGPAPTSPPASTLVATPGSSAAAPPRSRDAAPNLAALTPESVRACLGYPWSLRRAPDQKDSWLADGPRLRGTVAFESLPFPAHSGLGSSPHFFAFGSYAGPSSFRETLPEDWHALLRSEPVPFAAGKQATKTMIPMGMSGALIQIDLPSPQGAYTVTMLGPYPKHDSVQPGDVEAEASYQRLHALENEPEALAAALRCFDALLWP